MNPRNRQQYRNYSTWFLHRCIFCWITTCAILLHQNTANAQQQNIDNIVKLADLFEGPDVKCGSEVITVSFFWRDRQQPINGQVYVAGKDAVPDCVTAFNFTRWSRGYELKFDIDITSSKCVPDRKRLHTGHIQESHFHRIPLIVSLNREFQIDNTTVIKNEKFSYGIACNYTDQNTDKIFANRSKVQEFPLNCRYQTFDASDRFDIDNQREIHEHQVTLGQKLLHIWTCDFLNETNELDIDAAPKKPNDFCMKVHSCVAQNPEGQIDITDEQGCEKIPFSVRTIPDSNPLRYIIESTAFEFGETPTSRFACKIHVFQKFDHERRCPSRKCPQITEKSS